MGYSNGSISIYDLIERFIVKSHLNLGMYEITHIDISNSHDHMIDGKILLTFSTGLTNIYSLKDFSFVFLKQV